jgi:hypothetical protein
VNAPWRVIAPKYLPARPFGFVWFWWAFWVTHRIHPLPGWLVGVVGTILSGVSVVWLWAVWAQVACAPADLKESP